MQSGGQLSVWVGLGGALAVNVHLFLDPFDDSMVRTGLEDHGGGGLSQDGGGAQRNRGIVSRLSRGCLPPRRIQAVAKELDLDLDALLQDRVRPGEVKQ